MLHLIHDAAHVPSLDVAINTRTSHLAFHVDDFEAALQSLSEHQVEHVERVLPEYGYRQVFFRDPDGNVIELGEWPVPEEMFRAD